MKTEGLSFPESVEKLAREAGLEVPRATPQSASARSAPRPCRTSSSRRHAGSRSSFACRSAGRAWITYAAAACRTRRSTISGWASRPTLRDGLLGALKREGVPVDKLVEAGLVIQPEDSGRAPYDRFRGRVMFTINDRRGRVIAFGGRVMGAGEPKYLNSPETPLFHKGANLYCLDRARVASTRDRR